jgi:hypothetical protein
MCGLLSRSLANYRWWFDLTGQAFPSGAEAPGSFRSFETVVTLGP